MLETKDNQAGERTQQHTSGPWNVTEIWTIEDESHNPQQIALVAFNNRHANAPLIAAAPELLAALKMTHQWLTKPDVMRFLPQIEAAIAKAEGRSN